MNELASLPAWPRPVSDESRVSWLSRARLASRLSPRIWRLLVGGIQLEPERGRFPGGSPWAGFPAILGNISGIPVQWRISPELRTMHCPRCTTCIDGVWQLPQLVSFFDARRFTCPRHDCWLGYGAGPVSALTGEFVLLRDWLDEWIQGDITYEDGALRRDLVRLYVRNWSLLVAPCEAAYSTLSILSDQPLLPIYNRQWPPLQPSRLGRLSPGERLVALAMARRAWLTVKTGASLADLVPKAGKVWFEQRWTKTRVRRLREAQL